MSTELQHPSCPIDPGSDDLIFAHAVLDSQVSRIAVVDRNGVIIAVNEPWKQYARDNGASEAIAHGIGVDYLAITSKAAEAGDEDALKAQQGIEAVLAGERELFKLEYHFDLPGGKLWFEMFVTPLQWDDGGAVIVHHAIDDRKRAEMLILQQRAHLNAIFQGVDIGVAAITGSGQIARINDPGLEVLGLSRQQCIGKRFDELYSGVLRLVQDFVQATLDAGTVTRDHLAEVDLPHGHKVLLINVRPLPLEGGETHEALVLLRDVTQLYTLQREREEHALGEMIGRSPRMRELSTLVKQVAPARTTALILGESGVGKGVVASLLHQYSERNEGPFIAVNCAALSDTLLQSELFGHVKGAFTGAVNDRVGRFQRAAGGTLFLDEIGDISPAMQVALLRVLEERQFERLGDTRTFTTNARVVTATNRNLFEKVQAGEFREDLFYRLNVVTLHVPALRERKEDIPLLVNHFRLQFNREMGSHVEEVAPETMRRLTERDWPGNVRELRNTIERAFILCNDSVLLPAHLPPATPSVAVEPSRTAPLPQQAKPKSRRRRRPMPEAELRASLEEHDWNITHTAETLGYTRQYIHHLMRKYGIERE